MRICQLSARFLASFLLVALSGCTVLSGNTAAPADRLVPLNPRAWPTQAPVTATPRPSPFPRITFTPAAPQALPAAGGPSTPEARATATPPASGSQTAAVSGQVNKNAINLRAGPGTQYAIEGGLAPGAKFTVQATDLARDWLLVSVEGNQGWVEGSLVTLNGDTGRLPQVTPMPAAARPAATRTPTPTAAG